MTSRNKNSDKLQPCFTPVSILITLLIHFPRSQRTQSCCKGLLLVPRFSMVRLPYVKHAFFVRVCENATYSTVENDLHSRRIMTGGHFSTYNNDPRSLFYGGHYSSLHMILTSISWTYVKNTFSEFISICNWKHNQNKSKKKHEYGNVCL